MGRTRVYVVGDRANRRIDKTLGELLPWLKARATVVGVCDCREGSINAASADLLIILGGDGAILSAASRLDGHPVPLVGIRLGHFGFLAELEPDTCRADLERLLAGEGKVVERLMLRCEVWRGDETVCSELALNDAVITAKTVARMMAVDLDVDGEPVAHYRGDGLILSTPVGSTAYSLAAGGPVVEPGSQSIVVTPLAPHTLTSRPLVLDASRELTVRLGRRQRRAAALVLDGQRKFTVKNGDELRIRRAADPLQFVSIVERSFFRTLREKFRWAGSVPMDEEALDRRSKK